MVSLMLLIRKMNKNNQFVVASSRLQGNFFVKSGAGIEREPQKTKSVHKSNFPFVSNNKGLIYQAELFSNDILGIDPKFGLPVCGSSVSCPLL